MPDDKGGQGPAPEDEFDRELRELAAGAAPAPLFQELSAAERAKKGAAQARKARKARKAKKSRNTGRRGRWTGALVLVVILAVVGGITWLRFGHSAGGIHPNATGPTPSAGSASPVGTVSSPNLSGGPPADLFAGTPADGWADGAAGIVTSPARPVGGFTAAQVAAAYVTTRKLLIAAALDRKTLLGGPPAAFASLLFRQQRSHFLADLNKTGLAKDGSERTSRGWVIAFWPGSTALIGSVIRVHGTVSARPTTYSGYKVLEVYVNYRFVYPVEPPGAPADWMRVVAAFYGPIYFGDFAQTGSSFEPWVALSNTEAGDRCDLADGYVHPEFPKISRDNTQPSGPAVDPYSMANPHSSSPHCQRVTRT